ncbi:MAG: type 1 glutamine amidotransferase [Phycisphaeraceae bacterium]|nr:type 1 glutamine amidotransferase [Phycisphaeraceae bacterium]
MARLDNKQVAILVADGFEQVELTSPREALNAAGADTHIISPNDSEVTGWTETNWGDKFEVDVPLSEANADNYDALVLPGGVMNPDKLRTQEAVQKLIRTFFEQGKPIAAICHGPWSLIDAGVVKGKRMTSYHTLRTDLENAGVEWVDAEVVVDQGLVTSRDPNDLEAFNAKIIEEIAEGVHAGRRA